VGVHAEAKVSGDKAQGVSPEEEVEVVNWDQPQGEGEEPRYQEYPSDIPHEWDMEEAGIPEWDDDFDNDTRMEYHKRRCVFMAKHANDTLAYQDKRSKQ
jgi:hypothetical protein